MVNTYEKAIFHLDSVFLAQGGEEKHINSYDINNGDLLWKSKDKYCGLIWSEINRVLLGSDYLYIGDKKTSNKNDIEFFGVFIDPSSGKEIKRERT